VHAGQTATVVIDLSGSGLSERELRITCEGKPLAGYKVYLLPVDSNGGSAKPGHQAMQTAKLGTTGPTGMVNGFVPGSGSAEVWVENPQTRQLSKHSNARVLLSAVVLPMQVVDYPRASIEPPTVLSGL
jgi:hypothetical protein